MRRSTSSEITRQRQQRQQPAERIAAQLPAEILWRTLSEPIRPITAPYVALTPPPLVVPLAASCASRRSACYRFDADSTSWKERGTTTAMPGDRHAQLTSAQRAWRALPTQAHEECSSNHAQL